MLCGKKFVFCSIYENDLEDGGCCAEWLRLEIKERLAFVICACLSRDGRVDAKPIKGLFDSLADETNHQWV